MHYTTVESKSIYFFSASALHFFPFFVPLSRERLKHCPSSLTILCFGKPHALPFITLSLNNMTSIISSQNKTTKFHIPTTGAHVPEDKNQFLVQTPYGRGLVLRTRKEEEDGTPPATSTKREIELLDWKNAGTTSFDGSKLGGKPTPRPATLYTTDTSYPSVPPQKEDQVLTLYGRGVVVDVLPNNNTEKNGHNTTSITHTKVEVLLTSWRLDGRSRVRCFLDSSSVQVVRKKKLYEMDVFEKVERGQQFKSQAGEQFRQKNYPQALELYARAVESVRYVQHNSTSTNFVRADLLILMVTCSNNAATCCAHLGKNEEAIKFATNAVTLLEALEDKRDGKIFSIVLQSFDGSAATGLIRFGEWKTKSYLIISRAQTSKGDYAGAIASIKKGLDVIAAYKTNETGTSPLSTLVSMEREFTKLISTCKKRKKMQAEKERKRAIAMFATEKDEEKKDEKEETKPEKREKKVAFSPASVSESHGVEHAQEPSTKTRSTSKDSLTPPIDIDEYDLPWYKDSEVLTGLGILSASAIASFFLVSTLLRRRK